MRTEPNAAGEGQKDPTNLLSRAVHKIERGDQATASQLLKELGLVEQDSNPTLPELEQIISDILLSRCPEPSEEDEGSSDVSDPAPDQDTSLALAQFSITRSYGEWIGEPLLDFLLGTFGPERVREIMGEAFSDPASEEGPDFSLLNNKVFTREYQDSSACGLQILFFAKKRKDPMAVSLDLRKKIKATRGNLAREAAGMNASITFTAYNVEEGQMIGEHALPLRFQHIGDPKTLPRELLHKKAHHKTCLTGDIIASAVETVMKSNGTARSRFFPSTVLGLTGAWLNSQAKSKPGKQTPSTKDQDALQFTGAPLGALGGGEHFIKAFKSLKPEKELRSLVTCGDIDLLLNLS